MSSEMDGTESENPVVETEDLACAILRERGRRGREKYGETMDRSDLSPEQWATHHIEELADGLCYMVRVQSALRLLADARDMLGYARYLAEHYGKSEIEDELNRWLDDYRDQFPET